MTGAAEQTDVYELEWGPVPLAAALAAVASAVIALAQRDALVPPTAEVVLAAGAVSPWLVEQFTSWKPPRPLFALVTTAFVAALLASPVQFDFAPFVLVVMAGEVGASGRPWEALGLASGAAASLVALDVAGTFSGSGVWAAGILAALAFGVFAQLQLRLVDQTRRANATLAQNTALEERRRIAREVHDVVAHTLAVTMLHLTGARRSLETGGDVPAAVAALREAERAGRQSMNDIRQAVGLLATDDVAPVAPQPAAHDIPELVSAWAAAGVHVEAELTGDLQALPPAVGLGLYRIAQESLTNAARHAPGAPVHLRLTLDETRVALRVVNPRPPDPAAPLTPLGGWGVPGIRDRAAVLGGSASVGPDGDEWVVEVVVPRAAVPA